MEKKRGRRGASASNLAVHQNVTLRQEITGKIHVSASSILKMQHLWRLATWAGGEAGVSPLGALFGSRLAANSEAAAVPLDPTSILCERCESMLQPGFNCTTRIEKKKVKRRKKKHISTQNNVVYTCHFCSHRNVKGGTRTGHIKDLLASRPSSDHSSDKVESNFKKGSSGKQVLGGKTFLESESTIEPKCNTPELAVAKEVPSKRTLLTPLKKLGSLSDKKRKTSGSVPSKPQVIGNTSATNSGACTSGSSKRRRKTWSTLKEIAANNEALNNRSIGNFAIPFTLQSDKNDDKVLK